MDFEREIRTHFQEIIIRFKLDLISLHESQVFLIGRGFAISIAYWHNEIYLHFIEITKKNECIEYSLDRALRSRFTIEDRRQYGTPLNKDEVITSSLRVIASGLSNRCADILDGDRAWLIALRKKDRESWKGVRVSKHVENFLRDMLTRK